MRKNLLLVKVIKVVFLADKIVINATLVFSLLFLSFLSIKNKESTNVNKFVGKISANYTREFNIKDSIKSDVI